MTFNKFALIDMGSNSIRLVINAVYHNGFYKELHNFKVVARLSNHINENEEITDEGIDIVIDTVQQFSEIIVAHEVTETICVATAAVRNAKNQAEIIDLIQQHVGVTFRILNEYEEAYYGYLAVINSTNIREGLTIDIGGGSTEVTVFADRKLIHYHSFPFGAVTLKKRFIENDPPTEEEIDRLIAFLEKNFTSLPWLKNQDKQVIGIGGTARNLCLVHQRKNKYPLPGLHQYEMTAQDVKSIEAIFCSMTSKKRQNMNGLSKDRADIIIPGILAISTFLKCVGSEKFILSKKGLRDGLFYEQLLNDMQLSMYPNVAKQSLFQLIRHFHINEDHVQQNYQIAKALYEQLIPYIQPTLLYQNNLTLLQFSSYVFNIGEIISDEAKSEHTFYLLTNKTIDGLSHKDRLAIALIASFKSKSQLNKYYRRFANLISPEELKRYEFLGAIMKMAYVLDRSRRHVIFDLHVTNHLEGLLVIHLFSRQKNAVFEVELAQKQKKHLEKAINRQIELQIEHSTF